VSDHVFLDPYGTPYREYDMQLVNELRIEWGVPIDTIVDRYAPNTTISQNRGGRA
jgi:hypothetical protein